MAWNLWQPAQVQNIQVTLQEGGTRLAPNTTYYVKIIAADRGQNTTVRASSLTNWHQSAYSPYPASVSFATTGTARIPVITWNKVYKRNGVTEVDAYMVLISDNPDFERGEHLPILASPNYEIASTYANSYTGTDANMALSSGKLLTWHTIPDGLPYIWWSADGTEASFEGLYTWLVANGYQRFCAKRTSRGGGAWQYEFWGHIAIANDSSLTYTLRMDSRVYVIWGSLNIYQVSTYAYKPILIVNSSSHSYGTNFNWRNTSAIISPVVYMNTIEKPSPAPGIGKTWHMAPDGILAQPSVSVKELGAVHQYIASATPDTKIGGSTRAVGYTSTSIGRPGSMSFEQYLATLPVGQHIITPGGKYGSLWGQPHNLVCGYEIINGNVEFAIATFTFIDCIFAYDNYEGYAGRTFKPYIFLNTYGEKTKEQTYRQGVFAKTIRFVIRNEYGNALPGARITLTGSGGQNLCLNTTAQGTADNVGFPAFNSSYLPYGGDLRNVPNQGAPAEVYLYARSNNAGPNALTPGQDYWIEGERMKAIEFVEAYTNNYMLWRFERGVTNTLAGAHYRETNAGVASLIEALDSLATDANGEAWNLTPFQVLKLIQTPTTGSLYRWWNDWVTSGYFVAADYLPITVEIAANGYKPVKTLITRDMIEAFGVKPFVLSVQMSPAEPPIIVMQQLTASLIDNALSCSVVDDTLTAEVSD